MPLHILHAISACRPISCETLQALPGAKCVLLPKITACILPFTLILPQAMQQSPEAPTAYC